MSFRAAGVGALVALLLMASGAPAAPRADLVMRGGAIYTMDAARSWAGALAIKDGRLIYVGNDGGAAAYIGPHTRVIELNGRMVLPGFHDSHIHPVSGGLRLLRCQLNGLKTREAIYAKVRECVAAPSHRKWLLGNGWSADVFPNGSPRRSVLDKLVPGRPAFIRNVDGHLAWVNSRALAIAGIGAKTPDPAGGQIDRDPKTGAPSGTLREAAVNLVRQHIPPPTMEEYLETLRRTSAMANRFGITSINDANVNEKLLDVYQTAERAGTLTLRVLASQRIDTRRGPEQIDELIERRKRFKGKRLRANAAKIFVDGDFNDRTAALLAPYSDAPATRGRVNIEPSKLNAIVRRLDAEGFQVHMHVLGDRAIRMGLDAIEKAIAANGPRDRRHQLAHLAIIDPADLPRFRRLGVVADYQPLWAYPDRFFTKFIGPALGPRRSQHVVAIADMAASGAMIVAGSDWPAVSMNPLEAIQIAVTRRNPDGSGKVWLPEERARLTTMLAAYTIAGAWLAREDKINGSLETGKAADVIVLERNLFDVDPMKLRNVKVLLTLLDGEPVYRDPHFAWPAPKGK